MKILIYKKEESNDTCSLDIYSIVQFIKMSPR